MALFSADFAAKSSVNFVQPAFQRAVISGSGAGPPGLTRGLAPPSAFEIGSANFRPLQQFRARSLQRNEAVDHDIAAMGELQRVVGVLFDDQDGKAVLAVERPNGVENLEIGRAYV